MISSVEKVSTANFLSAITAVPHRKCYNLAKIPLRIVKCHSLSILFSVVDVFFDLSILRYIKEFVHGDFRRTNPSLGTLLGTEVDILELDVEVSNL